MADGHYLEIKQKFEGFWKVDRSENFDEFLKEMGVHDVVRKMYSMTKPISEITVKDNTIIINLHHAGVIKASDTFKLGEQFQTDYDGKKSKCKAIYDAGVLTIFSVPDNATERPTKDTRQITDEGEMLLTIETEHVTCKRWYTKQT